MNIRFLAEITAFLSFLLGLGLGFLLVIRFGTRKKKRKTEKNRRHYKKKQLELAAKAKALIAKAGGGVSRAAGSCKAKATGFLHRDGSLIDKQIGDRDNDMSWTRLNSEMDGVDEGDAISQLQKGEDSAYRSPLLSRLRGGNNSKDNQ